MTATVELVFDKGTITAPLLPEGERQGALASSIAFEPLKWDERSRVYRAPANAYREVVLTLRAKNISYIDKAKLFEPIDFQVQEKIIPRSYQSDALAAWRGQQSNGVVVLPTGAGKTILAVMAIAATRRPTLVHVPTIDLMHQWYGVLKKFFGEDIGLWGGGYNETHRLTVATYDSAIIHAAYRGNQFGLIVFDECHHLPGEQTKFAAIGSLAPFRLGLTATPPADDESRRKVLESLCGPICFEAEIRALEGNTLAPYDVVTLEADMEPDERAAYDNARKTYLDFVRSERIDFRASNGWQTFLWKAARSVAGREAFKAFLLQKKLSQASKAKEELVWDLLLQHRSDRILIFTQDNEMAYRIGKKFLLPVLTHHTKVKERESYLKNFREGIYKVLVTSKVLNEGVDVPEASVAIVVSGSGTVREHVQRLGRILRAQKDKRAVLYELVSTGTSEYFVNQRRRQHDAYQKSATNP